MRRNCNLELRLLPSTNSGNLHPNWMEDTRKSPEIRDEQQQLTIFYNGSVCVCDVTEIQARAILSMANKEIMEERERLSMKTPSTSGSEPASPTLQSPVCSPAPASGLSMKRSLQRFLQKRRHRIQETSPY